MTGSGSSESAIPRRAFLGTAATAATAGCSMLTTTGTNPETTSAPHPVVSAYRERLAADNYKGISGQPFELVDATYADGTLTATGRLAPTSLFPIRETLAGLRWPFVEDTPSEITDTSTLVAEVVDCEGDVIARETREIGDGRVGYEGLRELALPDEHSNGEVAQEEMTCSLWAEHNPKLEGEYSV